jgi:hypothetical protein
MSKQPSQAEIDAAAGILDEAGRHHGWWPSTLPRYADMDPIGKSEFGGIVEKMLMAAAKAAPKVFLLHHVHEFEDGHEDVKLIGVYTDHANAEAALELVKDQPGFRDIPEGFSITWSRLNPVQPGWSEGYVTAFPDGTFSD